MQIGDEEIYSVTEISLVDLMNSLDKFDGDLTVGYNTENYDTVLVIDSDPYLEDPDNRQKFYHNGSMFIWDVDLYSMQSVRRNLELQKQVTSDKNLKDVAIYYFENRAYKIFED